MVGSQQKDEIHVDIQTSNLNRRLALLVVCGCDRRLIHKESFLGTLLVLDLGIDVKVIAKNESIKVSEKKVRAPKTLTRPNGRYNFAKKKVICHLYAK